MLTATKKEWKKTAGASAFALEYDGLFKYLADKTEEPKSGQPRYYALVPDEKLAANAILEVVSEPKAKKTKLLKIFVNPSLWGRDQSSQLLDVYLKAVSCVFSVSVQHKTQVVKFYARTGDLLEVLTDLCALLESEKDRLPGIVCRMAGRWLEIERNPLNIEKS